MTISDESMNEGDDEKKFNYLKGETELRIGNGAQMNSDDDSNRQSRSESKSISKHKGFKIT